MPVFRAMAVLLALGSVAMSGSVRIQTEFPGGNVKVVSNKGAMAHLEPDLRGDRPWFYWYFEAIAVEPGRVTFVFPKKVIGFENGAIGFQGPAISRDQGKSWQWMGTKTVQGSRFFYEFARKGERVRFAVTIPYVESDLDRFLLKHRKNPHLKVSVLTKSRKGRKVELLQIGKPGNGKEAILITARHHAAETIASYVVEGLLQAAMADGREGRDFRKRYVLYAIPFVDKDGVESGDQGKNRKPHDHNRDYGDKSIYPEVKAIKKLGAEVKFRIALDFHCPTLVMKDHQVMYFVGAKEHPRHNFQNVSLLAERIKNELPRNAPVGPLVWLRSESKPSPKCSRYFAIRPGVVLSATLEIPFAPPGKAMSPTDCRKYGGSILRAIVGTDFIGEDGRGR